MIPQAPAKSKDEATARPLTLYTTIPILFLTGDQVDTVLKVLQFWRLQCRSLYARHKTDLEMLNGLVTLYDGKMCDTSITVSNFANRVSVSHAGGPSKEVGVHLLANIPLHAMGLKSLAPLCAAYDAAASKQNRPVITVQRAKDVCFALMRLNHVVPLVDPAIKPWTMPPRRVEAIAEETLQLFTQPISKEEKQYLTDVVRLCEEVDDKLTRGLQRQFSLTLPAPAPIQDTNNTHQHVPTSNGSQVSKPSTHRPTPPTTSSFPTEPATQATDRPTDVKAEKQSERKSGPGNDKDSRGRSPARRRRSDSRSRSRSRSRGKRKGSRSNSRSRSRGRRRGSRSRSRDRGRRRSSSSRSRSRSPRSKGSSRKDLKAKARHTRDKTPVRADKSKAKTKAKTPKAPAPPVIHIPDIAPGGRSGGSRVLGKRTYKNHEEAWSPESSDGRSSPERDDRPMLSRLALAVGNYECDFVQQLLVSGPQGVCMATLQRTLPIPREVLGSQKPYTWMYQRPGLLNVLEYRVALKGGSTADYRAWTVAPNSDEYQDLNMETRAYEFKACWYLAKHGAKRLLDLKRLCPIPSAVLIAADGVAHFFKDRKDLYEVDSDSRVSVRPDWRQKLGLPALPS